MKNKLINLIFPRRCPVCDEPVYPHGERICTPCLLRWKRITDPWCLKCGKKLFEEGEYCQDCLKGRHGFHRGRSLYEYKSVSDAIYRFKYGGRQEYAEFFGQEMAFYLEDFIRKVDPEGLVPVPLFKKREKERGYNQAERLATVVGECLKIPVYTDFLVRNKNTIPLKTLNPQERQNNLKKAFNVGRNDVKLRRVLIVDDIYTTGSTLDEMSAVMRTFGVEEINFITLAGGEGI